jgi:hypothetical protein
MVLPQFKLYYYYYYYYYSYIYIIVVIVTVVTVIKVFKSNGGWRAVLHHIHEETVYVGHSLLIFIQHLHSFFFKCGV